MPQVALKSLHALLSPAQYEALVGSPEYHWQVQTLVKEAAILQKVKSAHHEHILEFIGVAVDGEKPEYIVRLPSSTATCARVLLLGPVLPPPSPRVP